MRNSAKGLGTNEPPNPKQLIMSTEITLPTVIDIATSMELQYKIVQATGVLPFIAVGVGVVLIGWGGFKILSAWRSHQLREARKPILR